MKRTPRPVCSNTWILQPLHFSKAPAHHTNYLNGLLTFGSQILEPHHSLLLVSQNWNLGREASHIFGKCWYSQPEVSQPFGIVQSARGKVQCATVV